MNGHIKLRVGVLFGGRSGEHEVSLVSAKSVIGALDQSRYEIVPIGITKEGRWIAGPDALRSLTSARQTLRPSDAIITPDATTHALTLLRNDGHGEQPLDVIFPVLHGTYGEDGTIQGLLDLADLPYVGSGVLGSAVCMDKVIQKQICSYEQLPTVQYTHTTRHEYSNAPDDVHRRITPLGYPLFIKPANLGSSVGISKVHGPDELAAALDRAFGYDHKVIIEAAVPNAMEIEVALLGNEDPQASVAGQIIASNEFYDYDAKYVDGASRVIIPAPLTPALSDAIRSLAVKAFTACNCAGMARVDFLIDEKKQEIFLNEINTIPGFTSISMYPKLWQATGVSYGQLLDRLIELAIQRHEQKRNQKTSYNPSSEWFQK